MSTSRPFAYNTGGAIAGTLQFGNIAVGDTATAYNQGLGGVRWWNGPDEDLGWVIAKEVPAGNQPNPDFVAAYIAFQRTVGFNDSQFITMSEKLSGYTQTFADGTAAKTWLEANGYWTSYVDNTGLIVNWDIQNTASYSGTGSTITDLEGNSNGTITGTMTYFAGSPKYLEVQGGVSEYIYTTNLNPLLNPPNSGTAQSIFLWIYPTSNGIIYSEQGSLTPDGGWFDAQIQRNTAGNFLFAVWPYSLNTPLITSPSTYALNNWYNVGWTYNGSSFKAYVNGSEVGSTTTSRQTPYNNGGGLPMYFNLGYPTATDIGNTSACTYRLGSVKIYNQEISSALVTSNFNSSKSTYGL